MNVALASAEHIEFVPARPELHARDRQRVQQLAVDQRADLDPGQTNRQHEREPIRCTPGTTTAASGLSTSSCERPDAHARVPSVATVPAPVRLSRGIRASVRTDGRRYAGPCKVVVAAALAGVVAKLTTVCHRPQTMRSAPAPAPAHVGPRIALEACTPRRGFAYD